MSYNNPVSLFGDAFKKDQASASTQKEDPNFKTPAVQIGLNSSLSASQDIVKSFGAIPGGIVLNCVANLPEQLTSFEIDPDIQGAFVVNEKYKFHSGLTTEELSILHNSIFVRGEGFHRLGATSTQSRSLELILII